MNKRLQELYNLATEQSTSPTSHKKNKLQELLDMVEQVEQDNNIPPSTPPSNTPLENEIERQDKVANQIEAEWDKPLETKKDTSEFLDERYYQDRLSKKEEPEDYSKDFTYDSSVPPTTETEQASTRTAIDKPQYKPFGKEHITKDYLEDLSTPQTVEAKQASTRTKTKTETNRPQYSTYKQLPEEYKKAVSEEQFTEWKKMEEMSGRELIGQEETPFWNRVPFSPTRMIEELNVYSANKRLDKNDYINWVKTDIQDRKDTYYGSPVGFPLTHTKSQKIKPEEIRKRAVTQKKEDIEKIEKYIRDMAERDIRGVSIGGQIGDGLSRMPKFIVEYMVGASLSQRTIKTLTKALVTKKMKKKFGGKALEKAIEMFVIGGVSAGTVGQPEIVRGVLSDRNLEFLGFKEKQSLATRYLRHFGTQFIEYSSESAFAGGGKAIGKGKEVLKKLGWGGIVGEWGEEKIGSFMRAVAGLDEYENKGNFEERMAEFGRNMGDKRQNLVELGVLVPTAGVMGGIGKTASKIKKKPINVDIKKSIERGLKSPTYSKQINNVLTKLRKKKKDLKDGKEFSKKRFTLKSGNVSVEGKHTVESVNDLIKKIKQEKSTKPNAKKLIERQKDKKQPVKINVEGLVQQEAGGDAYSKARDDLITQLEKKKKKLEKGKEYKEEEFELKSGAFSATGKNTIRSVNSLIKKIQKEKAVEQKREKEAYTRTREKLIQKLVKQAAEEEEKGKAQERSDLITQLEKKKKNLESGKEKESEKTFELKSGLTTIEVDNTLKAVNKKIKSLKKEQKKSPYSVEKEKPKPKPAPKEEKPKKKTVKATPLTEEAEVEEARKAIAEGKSLDEFLKSQNKGVAKEFKIGDVLDPQGKTNMKGNVTISGIKGNTLKFTDSEGTEYAGMQRATVRKLLKENAWKIEKQVERKTDKQLTDIWEKVHEEQSKKTKGKAKTEEKSTKGKAEQPKEEKPKKTKYGFKVKRKSGYSEKESKKLAGELLKARQKIIDENTTDNKEVPYLNKIDSKILNRIEEEKPPKTIKKQIDRRIERFTELGLIEEKDGKLKRTKLGNTTNAINQNKASTQKGEKAAESIELKIGKTKMSVKNSLESIDNILHKLNVQTTVSEPALPAKKTTKKKPTKKINIRDSRKLSKYVEGIGKHHKRLSKQLDELKKDGTLTQPQINLIKAVISQISETKLAPISKIHSEIFEDPTTTGVHRFHPGYRKVDIGIRKGLGVSKKQITPSNWTGEVLATRTVLHELGHTVFLTELTPAEQKKATEIIKKKGFRSALTHFQIIEEEAIANKHLAYPQETFAQGFAEWVLTNKVNVPELLPYYQKVLKKLKKYIRNINVRKEDLAALEPFYEKMFTDEHNKPFNPIKKINYLAKAPILNIGTDITGSTRKVTEQDILEAIEKVGGGINASYVELIHGVIYDKKAPDEDTYAVHLTKPLTSTQLKKLAKELHQEAIPQVVKGKGKLIYATAKAQKDNKWGGYNPNFFFPTTGSTYQDIMNAKENMIKEIKDKSKVITDFSKVDRKSKGWFDKAVKKLRRSKFKDSKIIERMLKNLEGNWAVLSAENPQNTVVSEKENTKNRKRAEKWLTEKSIKFERVVGKYGMGEHSHFIEKMSEADQIEFAKEFNQESVLNSKGLMYQDGSFNPRLESDSRYDIDESQAKEDFMTTIKLSDGSAYSFSIGIDFNKKTKPTKITKGKSKVITNLSKVAQDFPQHKKTQDVEDITKGKNIEAIPTFSSTIKKPVEFYKKARKYYKKVKEQKEEGDVLPGLTTKEVVRSKIQDFNVRLETLMKVAKKKFGVKQLPNKINVKGHEELALGAALAKIEEMQEQMNVDNKGSFMNRLVNDGYDIQQLHELLYAQFAPKVNEKIKKDTDGENLIGSGMTNKKAKEIIAKYKGEPKLHKFAKEYRKMVPQKILDGYEANGLIKKEDAKRLRDFSEGLYVPFKHTNKDVFGKRKKQAGGGIIKRRGRTTQADNVVIQGLIDYEKAMILIAQNQIKQSLLAFNEKTNFKNSEGEQLITVKKQAYVPNYDSDGNISVMNERYKLKENEVFVKKDGTLHIITINDEQLARGLKRIGLSKGVPVISKLTSYLRNVLVVYNLYFTPKNFQRDFQTALINVSPHEVKKVRRQMLKNVFPAIKGIVQALHGNNKSKWAKIFNEYRELGAKSGWANTQDLDTRLKKYEKQITRFTSSNSPVRVLKATGNMVKDVNEAVENGVRVVVFETLRKTKNPDGKKLTSLQAAYVAKNLTVNFNKKGEWGSVLNALYLFSNASIQGSTILLKTLATSKKARRISAGLVGMQAILSALNYLLDDDDEYKKLSQYQKDNNWIFMLPNGKHIKIKVPFGYNVFNVMGNTITDIAFGYNTIGEGLVRVLNGAVDSFNPFGSSSSMTQFLVPTIIDPIVQMGENKNFFGNPLRPDQPQFQPKKPSSQMYFKSVRSVSKAITKWANDITGGSKIRSGMVDISPEDLDHIIDFFGGGVGKMMSDFIDTGGSLVSKGKLPNIRNIPFVNVFVGETSKYADMRVVYEMMKKARIKKYSPKARKKFNEAIKSAVKEKRISRKNAKQVYRTFYKYQNMKEK